MQSNGITLLNGATTLDTAPNDQVYLKDAISNFEKSIRKRFHEEIDENELPLTNANKLLTGRHWIDDGFGGWNISNEG